MNTKTDRPWLQIVNGVCVGVLIAIVAVVMWWRFLSVPPPRITPKRMDDYAKNVKITRLICERRQYPPDFAYPVPAVLMWRAVDSLGFQVAPWPGSWFFRRASSDVCGCRRGSLRAEQGATAALSWRRHLRRSIITSCGTCG